MANFTGKNGIIDDVQVPIDNSNPSNTLTGFTSEDFVCLELSIQGPQLFRFSLTLVRQANDLSYVFYNTRTGKVFGTTNIKGVYSTDGIDFVEETFSVDGVLSDKELKSRGISKATGSFQSADAEQIEKNFFGKSLVVGTNVADTLYATNNTYNKIFDNAGNDRIHGGNNGNAFFVGAGNDTLIGGAADDDYRFDSIFCFSERGSSLSFTKTITNFDLTQDTISIPFIANAYKMRFNDSATLANWRRGDMIFQVNGSDGWLLGNTDKDKEAEIKIVLTGVSQFNENCLGLDFDI